jgi:hypothetical protein
MVRIILGVIAGFFAWLVVWVGIEKILSALFPEWYGAPQLAFQNAIEYGGQFTAETRLLLSHIVIASLVAMLSGYLAALVSRENKRGPLILGILLLGVGLLKVVMSWPYVPMWYHIIFTVILLPLTILGGRFRANT